MLPDIPRPKPRDTVHPGDVENIHEKIQVGMFRDVTQHALGGKDVLIVNAFTHTFIVPPNICAKGAMNRAPTHSYPLTEKSICDKEKIIWLPISVTSNSAHCVALIVRRSPSK